MKFFILTIILVSSCQHSNSIEQNHSDSKPQSAKHFVPLTFRYENLNSKTPMSPLERRALEIRVEFIKAEIRRLRRERAINENNSHQRNQNTFKKSVKKVADSH